MKKLIAMIVILSSAAIFSMPAYAANLLGGNCSGSASSSAVCNDLGHSYNPVYGSHSLILDIASIVAFIAGIIAVIMLIIGSLKFVTSGGDSNAASSARGTIIGALVGLAIIALAYAIINFVVSKL